MYKICVWVSVYVKKKKNCIGKIHLVQYVFGFLNNILLMYFSSILSEKSVMI